MLLHIRLSFSCLTVIIINVPLYCFFSIILIDTVYNLNVLSVLKRSQTLEANGVR